MPKRRLYEYGQVYSYDNGSFIWSVGPNPFACLECSYRSSRKHDTLRHCGTHNTQWHSCSMCSERFARKDNLLRHVRTKHNSVNTFKCPHPNCPEAFKRSDTLRRHIKCHSGSRPFSCEHCEATFTRKESKVKHEQGVHDIGDIECPICCCKCSRLRACVTSNNIDTGACRKCFMKITGKNIRIEHEWSAFLDLHFYPDWRICSDNRVMGNVCHMYRPDGMWASDGFYLQWELDEYQHRRSGGNYDCDERRISQIYDEFEVCAQYVVVRVNPHHYKAPVGTDKPNQEDRKHLMLRVMRACLQRTWTTKIHVVYMFYSADNPKITQNLAKTLLFSRTDVDDFCNQS